MLFWIVAGKSEVQGSQKLAGYGNLFWVSAGRAAPDPIGFISVSGQRGFLSIQYKQDTPLKMHSRFSFTVFPVGCKILQSTWK